MTDRNPEAHEFPGGGQAAQPAPPAHAPARSSASPWSGVVAGAVLAGGLVLAGPTALERARAWWPASGGETGVSLVVLDTSSIAVSVMRKAMASDAEGAQAEGERVGRELLRVLETYRSAGVVVLNREHVLSAPPHLDVTEEVARKLGVDLARLEHRPLGTPAAAAARP